MQQVDSVVIGGGQAGLALGYYLAQQNQNFVILDAAPTIGHTWHERYDSLQLFTPAWYSHLPGLPLPLAPNDYPTKDDIARYLQDYATTFNLPVRLNTTVDSVHHGQNNFLIRTATEVYQANHVVIATGPFQKAYVPPFASRLAPSIFQIHSSEYRHPKQLPVGDVLIVGGGNSGAQIAVELAHTHNVYVAQGKRQPYLPQQLLGKDLFWWLRRLGVLKVTINSRLGQRLSKTDPVIGTHLRRVAATLPLILIGRVIGADKCTILLADGSHLPVTAVIWATGFRPEYGWIHVPVFDSQGLPVHQRGVTAVSGFYFLGLPWLHRRDSALLGGVGHDAAFLAASITRACSQSSSTRRQR